MKRVIVTGAGKGLGRAIAKDLASHGFGIVALDIDSMLLAEVKQSLRDSVTTARLDVSDETQVQDFFTGLNPDEVFGLVNNAGIYLGKSILDYTADEISRVVSVNLIGAINCSKYFAKLMLPQPREGAIVNLSSSSIYGGSDAVYSATKAALVGLTKACAMKFSPHIRVNAVAPGIVETDILKTIPTHVIEWYRKSELVKLPLQPNDVADSVRFLLSQDGKNYSGAVFDLNNGFHL